MKDQKTAINAFENIKKNALAGWIDRKIPK